MAPIIAKIRHTAILIGDEIFLTTLSSARFLRFPQRNWPFVRFELSRLCCHGPSLPLSSYLCRIKQKANSSCSDHGYHLQHLTHLLLDCLASEPFRRAIFGTTSSILDLWFGPWSVTRLLGFLCRISPRPHSSERVV